jgi:hypothetical protein
MIVCRECGHHNPNDATFCENAECGRFLEWSGEAVDTGILPRIDVDSPPPQAPGPAPPAPSPAPSTSRVRFVAALEQSDVGADPGGVARVRAKIINKGTIVDRFTLQVMGEAAPWTSPARPDVNLYPGTEEYVEVLFRPPRTPAVTTGVKGFRLRIASTEDPDITALLEGRVHLGAFHGLSAELVPRNIHGKERGRSTVRLENEGNAPLYVRLTAQDPDGALAFDLSPAEVEVLPGEESVAEVEVRARRPLRTGAPRTQPLQINVEADPVPEQRLDGAFVQAPSLPKIERWHVIGLRVVLTLLGALIMILAAFLPWLFGDRGLDVGYDEYASAAFDASLASPPSGLETVSSVALPAIFFAGLALLGMFGRGRLTRFATLLVVLLYVAFLITLMRAGQEPGIGVWAVIFGGVIAFIGGLLGYVKRSPGAE